MPTLCGKDYTSIVFKHVLYYKIITYIHLLKYMQVAVVKEIIMGTRFQVCV